MSFLCTLIGVLGSLALTSVSAQQVRPVIIPAKPQLVVVRPEFKNVINHGIAREVGFNAAKFLTHASLSAESRISDLSAPNQRLYHAARAEILSHRENFNVGVFDAFVRGLSNDVANVDIEAAIQSILMDVAAAESQDLRYALDSMKATNEAKKKMREKISAMEKHLRLCAEANSTACRMITKAELQADLASTKAKLDSMNEMSATESLRLQMVMDRMSKMMSTLSNLLKKMSDTAQGITQNIK